MTCLPLPSLIVSCNIDAKFSINVDFLRNDIKSILFLLYFILVVNATLCARILCKNRFYNCPEDKIVYLFQGQDCILLSVIAAQRD